MPFDGTSFDTPAARRARLIDALRNDTDWEWNFCRSTGCAIGMARSIWGANVNLLVSLGLTRDQYGDIFGFVDYEDNAARGKPLEWSEIYKMERAHVTPAMVADALERIV